MLMICISTWLLANVDCKLALSSLKTKRQKRREKQSVDCVYWLKKKKQQKTVVKKRDIPGFEIREKFFR